MIKEAYFRGLMKVAQATDKQTLQTQQRKKDRMLLGGADEIPGDQLQNHSFYKGTPVAKIWQHVPFGMPPSYYRNNQAHRSAASFMDTWNNPQMFKKLKEYYQSIGRQNRDFHLKHNSRPPKDYKYKTPFPFQNHPDKKTMMLQNEDQVSNNRGQQYSGHA